MPELQYYIRTKDEVDPEVTHYFTLFIHKVALSKEVKKEAQIYGFLCYKTMFIHVSGFEIKNICSSMLDRFLEGRIKLQMLWHNYTIIHVVCHKHSSLMQKHSKNAQV